MKDQGMNIEDLERIIRILKDNGVTEFELKENGTEIKLSREKLLASPDNGSYVMPVASPAAVSAPAQSAAPAALSDSNSSSSATQDEVPNGWQVVDSPIVGTFYRKPSPEADSFVNIGDSVKRGQTLCIIEAMKLMNEIESPCDGKIEKILVEDGEVAEFGERLFMINPAG